MKNNRLFDIIARYTGEEVEPHDHLVDDLGVNPLALRDDIRKDLRVPLSEFDLRQIATVSQLQQLVDNRPLQLAHA